MSSDPSAPRFGDEELLRRFLAGERKAFRTVEGWAREIVRFRPYGIPRDAHEDVVQHGLALLWQTCGRPGFALRTGLRPFVRKIVLARCVDWLRRRRNEGPLEETIPDPALSLEDAAIADDRWRSVQRALMRLQDRCRELIRLHFLDGLPYAELAGRLGLQPSTVRVRMFHCMKEVRRQLDLDAGREARSRGDRSSE